MPFDIPQQSLSLVAIAAAVILGLIFFVVSRKSSDIADEKVIEIEKKKRTKSFGWVLPVSVIAGAGYGFYSGDIGKWVNIGVWGGFLLSGIATAIAKANTTEPFSGGSQESIKRYSDKDTIA